MKVDLAIIGQGAVTPAGIGLDALLKNEPTPIPTAGLRRPDHPWPVLRVDLKNPALARWQNEPRLRRSSPITLFLVEAAEQALAGVSAADRAQTGLIIAFSAGCLLYSHRFFDGILTLGQKMASPALFPETVFNSPGSHVAAALKLNGAVYALCGDETAWIAALKTAAIWLQRDRVRQVLVLGAEEFDPLVLDAYASARWLRRDAAKKFIPSEGAAGLLVRRAAPGDPSVITTARDGFIYRNKKEAAAAAKKMFRDIDPTLPAYRTAQRTWLAPLEEKTISAPSPRSPAEPPYLGEAFTASAAWNTLRAVARAHDQGLPGLLLPLWGLNHQLGVLTLSTP
jgi:3-oxoacyl-(acyl-carrier-protein) synthase